MDENILKLLKKGSMSLQDYQKILAYYLLKGYETDYFGGGGVDGKGIWEEYVINYCKENSVTYKLYREG